MPSAGSLSKADSEPGAAPVKRERNDHHLEPSSSNEKES
jgi:hypothetical protein